MHRAAFPLSLAAELPATADSMGFPYLDQDSNMQQQSREKVTVQDTYGARDPCFLYKLLILVKRQELNN